jgi:GxxExxY protein
VPAIWSADAAYRIHTSLGPGLLESVYEVTLAYELENRGLGMVRQQPIPIIYQGVRIEVGFRADLIVEDRVIVEIKSVEVVAPVHKQLLTHRRLTDQRLGAAHQLQCCPDQRRHQANRQRHAGLIPG